MIVYLKRILLNFYLVLQIFAASVGLLSGSFSHAEKDLLKEFQNLIKEDIPSKVEEVKNSVVRLESNQKDNIIGTGFILEDGVLVTNAHFLQAFISDLLENRSKTKKQMEHQFKSILNEDLSFIEISQEDRLLNVQVTSIQALDPVHDLVLLNIKGDIPPAIKKSQGEVDLKKEKLFFVGYPNEELKAIGQKGPIQMHETFFVSMPISLNNHIYGASGSPVVNQKGELMGVLDSGMEYNAIFSYKDHLFSLQNAGYGVQCSKNKSIKNCFQQAEDFHLKEAEKGDVYAQYQLGRFFYTNYFYSKGRENNFEKWMKSAAQAGFVKAQTYLGEFYYFELGKHKEGLKWLEQASEQGYFMGTTLLAEAYYEGKGVTQNFKKAFQLYKKAIQEGSLLSLYNLASMYFLGEGVSQNYKKAFELFKASASKGYLRSLFSIAYMYRHGKGRAQDKKKALEIYHVAAQQGNLESQIELGSMYYYGQGVTKDFKQAFKWYELAALQGDIEAQFHLGLLYYWGEGVIKDLNQAFKWYELAAAQGEAEAQFYLGSMYYYGDGVFKDFKQAFKWFEISASQKNIEAHFMVGNMYYWGEGVTQDFNKAVLYFKKAAIKGHEGAESMLGLMYDYGEEKEESSEDKKKTEELSEIASLREELEPLLNDTNQMLQKNRIAVKEHKEFFSQLMRYKHEQEIRNFKPNKLLSLLSPEYKRATQEFKKNVDEGDKDTKSCKEIFKKNIH